MVRVRAPKKIEKEKEVDSDGDVKEEAVYPVDIVPEKKPKAKKAPRKRKIEEVEPEPEHVEPEPEQIEPEEKEKEEVPKSKPKPKSRKEKAIEDFMLIQLPALKKEMKIKKKDQASFNVRDFPHYFKIGGDFVPTYCLNLFHFLGKNEIICSQYGVFESNRHLVKTVEGFNHANLIITSVGPDTLTPEEAEHMMKRFGREWFKIPAKDGPKVASAFRFGDGHQFRMVLTGIYEDSFFGEDGEEIRTANPVLRYEPFRAPAAPQAKKRKVAASSSSSSLPVTTPAEELAFVSNLLEENEESGEIL